MHQRTTIVRTETQKESIYVFTARGYASTCLLLIVPFHSCGKYIVNIFFPELLRLLTGVIQVTLHPTVPLKSHAIQVPLQSAWLCCLVVPWLVYLLSYYL